MVGEGSEYKSIRGPSVLYPRSAPMLDLEKEEALGLPGYTDKSRQAAEEAGEQASGSNEPRS